MALKSTWASGDKGHVEEHNELTLQAPGMLNIQSYWQSGDADYTSAIQRAVAVAIVTEQTIYIPQGTFTMTGVTLPRNNISFMGGGPSSKLVCTAECPMFTWDLSVVNVIRGSFVNLWLENTALNGGILYHGTSLEFMRLQLTMDNVICQYRGGCDCLHLDGLVGSNLSNVDIKGGSPVGGGTFSGRAMYIKDSSTTHFWNVKMYSGVCGDGFYVTGGGELWFHGSRLDGGSRNDNPAFWFYNVKSLAIEDFTGEGVNDNPWMLLDTCHDVWIKNPIGPGLLVAYKDQNIMELRDCHNVTIQGGRFDDQHANGGTGVALFIDSDCTLITGRDLRFCGVFLDNLSDAGTGTILAGTEGGANFYYPPTARFTYP